MPKYIVEQLMTYRNVYVVEAENEAQATKVAEHADDNWQKFLGTNTPKSELPISKRKIISGMVVRMLMLMDT